MLVYEVEEIQLSTGPTHRTEAPDLTEEVGQLFHVFLASKVLQLPKKKDVCREAIQKAQDVEKNTWMGMIKFAPNTSNDMVVPELTLMITHYHWSTNSSLILVLNNIYQPNDDDKDKDEYEEDDDDDDDVDDDDHLTSINLPNTWTSPQTW